MGCNGPPYVIIYSHPFLSPFLSLLPLSLSYLPLFKVQGAWEKSAMLWRGCEMRMRGCLTSREKVLNCFIIISFST